MKVRYRILKTFEQVKTLVEYCKETGNASIDFETKATGPDGPQVSGDDKKPTGPAYIEDEPTLISIVFQPGALYCVPLFHKESPFTRTEALTILKYIGHHVMENPSITKWAWNLKFEYKWFLRYGILPKGRLMDVMGLKYMLNEERPNGLKEFVWDNIPGFGGYDQEIDDLKKQHKGWANIPLKPLAKYCCLDSDLTLRIGIALERIVIKEGLYLLFRNMFMMQTRVLAESEAMGMPVDRPYLEELVKTQKKRIEVNERKLMGHPKIKKFQRWRVKQKIKKLILECKQEISEIKKEAHKSEDPKVHASALRKIKNREEKIGRYVLGELTTNKEVVQPFNPNSPPQLVDLLFRAPGGFEFKVVKYTLDDRKQPTQTPSTAEDVLLVLKKKDKSGFIDRLLKQREMAKLYSTYMVAPLYRLTPNHTLHSSFLITGTVTGRLSSKNINMQNIPRDTTSSLIKKMFIPPPGHLLLEVDYGQAELRVVAELARCKALIEIFKMGYNVHLATGLKIIGEYDRYEEIKSLLKDADHPDHTKWEKVKKRGKVLNFSILYLQSDEMTAEQMECSVEEAARFKADWFAAFPEIKKWMDKQTAFVKKHGYVKNIFGRYRRLPDIWSEDKGKRNKAIRDCINAPIQGGSSDFTQFATVIIRERILEGTLKLSDNPRWQSQAYTVHDSMGFWVEPKYLHNAAAAITAICSDPETLKYFGFEMKYVKMKVSPEVGVDWGSLRDYHPEEDYTKLLNQTA